MQKTLDEIEIKLEKAVPPSLIIIDEKDFVNKILEGTRATERGEVYDIEEVFDEIEKMLDSQNVNMVKYSIKLSIRAKRDFSNIFFYFKNVLNEPFIAKKYLNFIKQKINSLQYIPKRFTLIDEYFSKDEGYRKFVIKNYIVIYRINKKERIVNIERILYGGYNWKYKI